MTPWEIVPRIAEGIIRILGWSPVGKRIKLIIEQASDATRVGEQRHGTIVAADGSAAATLLLDDQTEVFIRARHAGYGMLYLPIGSIAVYVAQSKTDTPFALADLARARSA